MITGEVNSRYQATIGITVRGPAGQARETVAVIDTGFDGSLSLPLADIAALGLPWRRRGRAQLADGTTSFFDVYGATVLWDGAPRPIPVHAANVEPLLGMRLLAGYELTIQAVAGGHGDPISAGVRRWPGLNIDEEVQRWPNNQNPILCSSRWTTLIGP